MKALFFLAIAVYVFFMLLGLKGVAYIDNDKVDEIFDGQFLWFILISLAIGIPFFFWFLRLFPKQWQVQNAFGRFMLLIMFPIVSLMCNRYGMIVVNNYIGYQQPVTIAGTLTGKYAKDRQRGMNWYYLQVSDSLTAKEYTFEVSKAAYQAMPHTNVPFNKEFKIGCFGILYRKKL